MEQAFVLVLLPHRDALNRLAVQLLDATTMKELDRSTNTYLHRILLTGCASGGLFLLSRATHLQRVDAGSDVVVGLLAQ